MLRALTAFVGVFVGRLVIAVIISWLAHRRKASKLLLLSAVNTVLFFCVFSIVGQFRDEGPTVFSVFYSLLMIWLAHGAASGGNIGIKYGNWARDGDSR